MIYDYKIAIPSYKRSKTIKEKTLKILEKYNIDPLRVTIFVADEEEEKLYKESLKDTNYNNFVVGVLGIGPQRNFIERYYPEGTYLIMLDDDISDILKKITDKEMKSIDNFEEEIIYKGFDECIKNKAKLFGIYAVANPFFMKERVKTDLSFIIALMMGIIVEHSDDLVRQTNHGEDQEYSIRQYIKNGSVVRLDNFTVKTFYAKEQGGMQLIRTKEYIYESIKKVQDMFPDYCTMYIRESSGNAELRLKDKRKQISTGSTLDSFFG